VPFYRKSVTRGRALLVQKSLSRQEETMNDEGKHWSDPTCVLCSWLPDLEVPEGDLTDRLCRRCRRYDGASTATRIREPQSFYLAQADACEKRARFGTEKDIAPFSRLMWERTALRWKLAAVMGFRWIPNTRAEAIFLSRRPVSGEAPDG
jgi:hypothetical protein